MRKIARTFLFAIFLSLVILARRGMAEPPIAAGEAASWVELHGPDYDEDGPG